MAQQRITVDTQLIRGPAYLLGFILTPDAVGAATVNFYDGVSATDRRVGGLSALTSQSIPVTLPQPARFERGIFVDVGANVSEVWCFYEPVRDELPAAGGQGT